MRCERINSDSEVVTVDKADGVDSWQLGENTFRRNFKPPSLENPSVRVIHFIGGFYTGFGLNSLSLPKEKHGILADAVFVET